MKMSKEKSNRTTILIFNEYYLPGTKFGGPVQSISNIVEWLGDYFKFKIITRDRDFLSNESYSSISVDSWNKVGKADVYYISPDKLGFKRINDLLNEIDYDLLYLNSLFNPYFTLLPLFVEKLNFTNKPKNILIAPRGELSKGALEQKRIKKNIFLKIASYFGVKNHINWHATDKVEQNNIIEELDVDGKQIFISSNLPSKDLPDVECVSHKKEGQISLIYLSRITPKKNLAFILEALDNLKDVNIKFDLYGTIDDKKYWRNCQNIIRTLSKNIKVKHHGHLDHSEVLETISDYDLFVLPTKGENFGHAIIESISAGTPVLISTKTPWRDLNKKNVGWDFDLDDKKSFQQKIKELAELNPDEMSEIKKKVKNNYTKTLESSGVEDTRRMFQEIITKGNA